MLYPQQNSARNLLDLSGIWNFQTDPDLQGESGDWAHSLPAPRPMAVPGSWNEQYTDLYAYLGPAWYARSFFVPAGWQGQCVMVRVGSANYAAQVWLNGQRVGEHEGGHLPFEFDLTARLNWGGANTLAIRVENELKPTRVPAGNLPAGGPGGFWNSYPSATFDFYPYAGLHRPVVLYSTPLAHIQDVTVTTAIDGTRGVVMLSVRQAGSLKNGRVSLSGGGLTQEAELIFAGVAARAGMVVENARLWSPEDPFLYTAQVSLLDSDGREVDRYQIAVGIRTIQVTPEALLLNGKPLFLKGFGRHEDFFASGRGLNLPLLVKDYDLLHWVGANSYRTSHYPYSEEEMAMADRQGILIIDEIPAVSLHFEDSPADIQIRLETAQRMLRELVARDKNHPSVIVWSVANEPMSPDMMKRMGGGGGGAPSPADGVGRDFLSSLIDLAHKLDSTRLATLEGMIGCPVDWVDLADVVCINRYWGWYTLSGQPEMGAKMLEQELDGLYAAVHKPIVITEFGADTVAGMHSLPPKMFTEEYQVEFLRGYLDVAARKPFVAGLHVWNFADFQATQSPMRVGGMNHKGVFTRERQPKMAAHFLRERWTAPAAPQPAVQAAVEAAPGAVAQGSPDGVLEALNQVSRRLEGKYPGMSRTIGFQLEGEGFYRLVLEDGHCRAEAGEVPTDASIRLKVEDALKLLSGELNPMSAFMTGKVKISGDMKALMILQNLV